MLALGLAIASQPKTQRHSGFHGHQRGDVLALAWFNGQALHVPQVGRRRSRGPHPTNRQIR